MPLDLPVANALDAFRALHPATRITEAMQWAARYVLKLNAEINIIDLGCCVAIGDVHGGADVCLPA